MTSMALRRSIIESILIATGIALLAATLLLGTCARGATITVQPGNGLQAAIASAPDGSTITLVAGDYTGGINTSGKSGLVIQGPGILRGSQVVLAGNECTLRGVQVIGARTSWYTGAVLITGKGNTLEDVHVHDNESLGIDISGGDATTLRRVKSNHNGNLGLNTGSPAAGNNVEGLVIEDSEFDGNNYGMTNPVWAGVDAGKVKQVNGLWYRLPGDAAGGAKICNAHDVIVRRSRFRNNKGPGLWFDVYCGKKQVIDCEATGNHNIPNDPGWTAPGVAIELENAGTTLIENLHSRDNTGSEVAIWEARNVTVRNSLMGGNIELRDLGGGRENYRPMNIRLEGLKLTGQVSYWNDRTKAQVVEVGVQKGLASLPAWSMPGSTDTPTTSPTPAVESAEGTRVTQPGQIIVTRSGDTFRLTADRKIIRNGITQTETNSVDALLYVGQQTYQTAHGLWWRWGVTWTLTTEPSVPATQPTPADPTVAELLAKIGALEASLASEKAARAADAATIAALQTDLAAAKTRLESIKQAGGW